MTDSIFCVAFPFPLLEEGRIVEKKETRKSSPCFFSVSGNTETRRMTVSMKSTLIFFFFRNIGQSLVQVLCRIPAI